MFFRTPSFRSGSPQRRHSVDESPVQSMENKENKENKDGGYIHQEYAAGLGWLKHVRSHFHIISAIRLIFSFFNFNCFPL